MDKLIAKLEDAVQRHIAAHEKLLTVMKLKVDAFRRADQQGAIACTRQENAEIQLIGEIEKQRLILVAELTRIVEPGAPSPFTMGELAQRLPEPSRGRLLILRGRLKDRMETVQRESSVARRAAETLLRHMQGIVQSISGVITGISTYGKKGAPPRMAMNVSTFSATG
jgi:hypothetical protein